ncbi:DNA gyrase inhibitor YacG [Acetobacter pasteurianus]|uniref:DNA gyrase inhibitor YacG n=1 Tax=Acetobacter pasteurianus TaxID=438 RepID=UPI003D14ED8B
MISKPAKCPVCGKPAQAEFRPFCSKRCADVDLGRWFSGDYRIPGAPAPIENDEKAERNDER